MRQYTRVNILILTLTASLGALLAIASISEIDITFHEQITDYSCGAACLESVMEYWGTDIDQQSMLEAMPPLNADTGYTVGELKDIAISKGLQAFAIIGNLSFLAGQIEKKRPVIVPIMITYNEYRFDFATRAPLVGPVYEAIRDNLVLQYSHFVLVFEVDEDSVRVVDPMYGTVRIPKARFEEMWAKRENALLLVAN